MKEDTQNRAVGQGDVHSDKVYVAPVWRFLYLLLAPLRGWKRMKNAGYAPEVFASKLFFPLLALLALSRLAVHYYTPEGGTLVRTVQDAVSLFVAGFSSYWIVVGLGRTFLPPEARLKIDSRFGRVYVLTCLSALALATTIYTLIPGLGLIYIVAPIYVAYLIVKGIRFLRVPEGEIQGTTLLLVLLILGAPLCVYLLLESLMPSA